MSSGERSARCSSGRISCAGYGNAGLAGQHLSAPFGARAAQAIVDLGLVAKDLRLAASGLRHVASDLRLAASGLRHVASNLPLVDAGKAAGAPRAAWLGYELSADDKELNPFVQPVRHLD